MKVLVYAALILSLLGCTGNAQNTRGGIVPNLFYAGYNGRVVEASATLVFGDPDKDGITDRMALGYSFNGKIGVLVFDAGNLRKLVKDY